MPRIRKTKIKHSNIVYNKDESVISTSHIALLTDRHHADVMRSARNLLIYTHTLEKTVKASYKDSRGVTRYYYNLPYPIAALVIGKDCNGYDYVFLEAVSTASSLPHLIELLEEIKQQKRGRFRDIYRRN